MQYAEANQLHYSMNSMTRNDALETTSPPQSNLGRERRRPHSLQWDAQNDWIQMPFGVVSGVGPGMGVLDGGRDHPREWALLGWIWGVPL